LGGNGLLVGIGIYMGSIGKQVLPLHHHFTTLTAAGVGAGAPCSSLGLMMMTNFSIK